MNSFADNYDLFEHLYSYYVQGQMPINYYKNNRFINEKFRALECSYDKDGNYFLILNNGKKVILYFVLGPIASRQRSLPIVQQDALNKADRTYIDARYSYEKALTQMTMPLTNGSDISMSMPNVSQSDLMSQNIDSNNLQVQNAYVSLRYYVLKLYKNDPTRYDLSDMSTVEFGQVSVTDRGLFLDDQPLDIVFQLVP